MAAKVILLGLVVGVTDTLISATGGVWGLIITLGAGIGALAIIWQKGARPLIAGTRKLLRAADVVMDLPEELARLREWQGRVEGRLDVLEGRSAGKPDRGLAHPHES